ncbi:hypothetical protein L1987_05659 [Smallanthus sonchifolius]|uniref:Uncharacterized protein n=1 Tax=Smallanthus sonchifolius TaxID=185202 RepID=A0ACB9JWC8_9ASTR|nr:hypothetical protein L1987_05659 [Smallanthus sonchifolius]
MQSGIPTRYQRQTTRQEMPARQYPLRQPRPDPLTLDSLYDSMQTGFGDLRDYVDEQFGGPQPGPSNMQGVEPYRIYEQGSEESDDDE